MSGARFEPAREPNVVTGAIGTREIGIRMALGADRARMLRMLFRPTFVRVLPAFDPMLLVVVPAAFLACAVRAAHVPARRAARVDPNVALRAQQGGPGGA